MTSKTTAMQRTPLGPIAAVVLILIALVVGFRVGRPPAPNPTGAAADTQALFSCSMHPTVRLPDPDAKCPICFMDLIPVGDSDAETDALSLSNVRAEQNQIHTSPVIRAIPSAAVSLYGKLAYDQTSVVLITAQFPGRLERVFIHYPGVPVTEGDHLAEIYSPELLAAFAELRQARIAFDQSQSSSQIVRQSTQQTLAAARDKLRLYGISQEQATAAEEGQSHSDSLTIYSPITGTITELDMQEGHYVQTGSHLATVADLSRLWLDLQAFESQLPLLRWGQRVTFTVVAQPGVTFEGRISFIEPIVSADTRSATVRVAVDNSEGRLKPGMFATATVRPRLGEHGVVLSDPSTNPYACPMHPTITDAEPSTCSICGMDLVPTSSLTEIPESDVPPLVIPASAALITGTRAVVYVAVNKGETSEYEAREVTLGPRAGDHYVVTAGLAEGERVVTSGAFRIDSEMQIRAKPSMMSMQDSGSSDSAADSLASDLTDVFTAYLDAQEALADDDLAAFNTAAAALNAAAASVDNPSSAWSRNAAAFAIDAPFEDIAAARIRFHGASNAAITLASTVGHTLDTDLELTHCPMAFDFTGASWLQRPGEIDNPYFGAEMLTCGTTEQVIPANTTRGHEHD